MSVDEIKLNIPMAEEMFREFDNGATSIEEISQEMQNISGMLKDGALIGRGGMAFSETIEGNLCQSLDRFADKLREMRDDVNVAIEAMRGADERSKNMMGD